MNALLLTLALAVNGPDVSTGSLPFMRNKAAQRQELIDTLKREVPIWKREGFADGSHTWVGI